MAFAYDEHDVLVSAQRDKEFLAWFKTQFVKPTSGNRNADLIEKNPANYQLLEDLERSYSYPPRKQIARGVFTGGWVYDGKEKAMNHGRR